MLKGNYTTIIISVILHLLLLVALIYSAPDVPTSLKVNKTENTAIKSFLYIKPKKPTQAVVTKVNVKKPEKSEIKKVAPKQEKSAAEKPPSQRLESQQSQPQQAKSEKVIKTAKKIKSPEAVKSPSTTKFSSLGSLSNLRNKLDQNNRLPTYNKPSTNSNTSSMLGQQALVPETTVPLTEDQQKALNTSRSHFSSITKNGDGICTIHREQMLGSPVQATTSSFACGESDFDRSFRLHMQEVQRKLLPNKKK